MNFRKMLGNIKSHQLYFIGAKNIHKYNVQAPRNGRCL